MDIPLLKHMAKQALDPNAVGVEEMIQQSRPDPRCTQFTIHFLRLYSEPITDYEGECRKQ